MRSLLQIGKKKKKGSFLQPSPHYMLKKTKPPVMEVDLDSLITFAVDLLYHNLKGNTKAPLGIRTKTKDLPQKQTQ